MGDATCGAGRGAAPRRGVLGAATAWARAHTRLEWTSTLVVALVLAIASGAVMAGVAGARRAGSAPDRFFESTGWPAVLAFSEEPMERDWLLRIRDDPRVTSMSEGSMVLAAPTGIEPGLEGTTMVLPDERWGRDTSLLLAEGRYPAPGARDEVAVNELSTRAGLVHVGDWVDLNLLTPAGLQACLRGEPGCVPEPAGRVQVVGAVRTPQDLAVDAYTGLQLFARPEFTDRRGGPEVATGHLLFVNLAGGVDSDQLAAEWSTGISRGNVQSDREDRRALDRAADMQRPALLVASGIAAVAGAITVAQAMSRLLGRRRGEAETLGTIGLTRAERAAAAFAACLPAIVVGSGGGVVVALGASPAFPFSLLRRADPGVGVNADWTVLLAGVLLTSIAACALAALAALRWATPQSGALSRSVSRPAAVAAALGFGPVASTGTRFALERGRGAQRVPVIPALVGAAFGLAVLVSALVLRESIDGLLASPARFGAPWDLQVVLAPDALSSAPVMADDERISRAAVVMSAEIEIEAEGPARQVAALGYEPMKGSLPLVVLDGRFLHGPDEAVLATDTMRDLGVELGDDVVVRGPRGEAELSVVGRVVKPITGDAAVNEGVVVPLDTLLAVGAVELAAEVDQEGALLAEIGEPADVEVVEAELLAQGSVVDRPFRQAEVSVLREIRAVPLFLALVTAVLGALATAHALVTAARRRRRDLAVLRSLGFRPGQAAGVIRWQAAVLALVALTLALPAGVIVGSELWGAIAEAINVVPVVDVPIGGLAVVVVAALAGALLLAVAPAAWVSRRRPAASLRDE